ncbi:hypothetical protein ACLMJK_001407 [Lecanora helva]
MSCLTASLVNDTHTNPSSANPPANLSGLEGLPQEILDEILKLLFADKTYFAVHTDPMKAAALYHVEDLAILRICKHLTNRAIRTFYSLVKIRFYIYPLRLSLYLPPQGIVDLVKNVEFHVSVVELLDVEWLEMGFGRAFDFHKYPFIADSVWATVIEMFANSDNVRPKCTVRFGWKGCLLFSDKLIRSAIFNVIRKLQGFQSLEVDLRSIHHANSEYTDIIDVREDTSETRGLDSDYIAGLRLFESELQSRLGPGEPFLCVMSVQGARPIYRGYISFRPHDFVAKQKEELKANVARSKVAKVAGSPAADRMAKGQDKHLCAGRKAYNHHATRNQLFIAQVAASIPIPD